MNRNINECPICKGLNIKNNSNSAVDSYEFYCSKCTYKYYLILSSGELDSLKALIYTHKDKLLTIFKEDIYYDAKNSYPIFDYHRPITYEAILRLINN